MDTREKQLTNTTRPLIGNTYRQNNESKCFIGWFFFTLAVTENKSMNTVQTCQVPAFSITGFTENRRVCGLQQLKSRYVSKKEVPKKRYPNRLKNRSVFSVLSLSLSSASSSNIHDQCLTITDVYGVPICFWASVRTLTECNVHPFFFFFLLERWTA